MNYLIKAPIIAILALIAVTPAMSAEKTAKKPLKVFILVGQSNMVGPDQHLQESVHGTWK